MTGVPEAARSRPESKTTLCSHPRRNPPRPALRRSSRSIVSLPESPNIRSAPRPPTNCRRRGRPQGVVARAAVYLVRLLGRGDVVGVVDAVERLRQGHPRPERHEQLDQGRPLRRYFLHFSASSSSGTTIPDTVACAAIAAPTVNPGSSASITIKVVAFLIVFLLLARNVCLRHRSRSPPQALLLFGGRFVVSPSMPHGAGVGQKNTCCKEPSAGDNLRPKPEKEVTSWRLGS